MPEEKKTNQEEQIQYKTFKIDEFKLETKKDDDGKEKFYISGYANTKNKPDAYGDIPTGDKVYDLKRFKDNPLLLVDHWNSAGNIAGRFTKAKEDDKGLAFRARLRNLDDIHTPTVKDAVSAYMTGFGKALSIGGLWYYEDEKNPRHLTRAVIHEISLVGVGADGDALTDSEGAKILNDNLTEKGKKLNSAKRNRMKKMLIKKIEEIKKNE